jgi:hypothetical protein
MNSNDKERMEIGLSRFLQSRGHPALPGGAAHSALPDKPPLVERRGRLCFAFDATASREGAWEAAKKLTDVLFQALPGRLDIALAVHGGSQVHTFTEYLTDARRLRDIAARIGCIAGGTQLLPILARVTQEMPKAEVVVYIGDCFEEDPQEASRVADRLKAQGTRVIILQDDSCTCGAAVFADIAARTGGAVLAFDLSSLKKLRELLAAVAVLAVGGEKLLEAKRKTMPGALMLLDQLNVARIEGGKKR